MKQSVKSYRPSCVGRQVCNFVVQTIENGVKAHGGELKVETKENVGSEFFISLPTKLD